MSVKYKRKDVFYEKAQEDGYRSRAAYKLLEIQKKYKVMKKGDFVLDLGAWPGSWTQVANRVVDNSGKTSGKVVGIDLVTLESFAEESIEIVTGDYTFDENIAELKALASNNKNGNSNYDVIICDASPKLTGIRERDEAGCDHCNRGTMYVASKLLKEGGNLVMKIFPFQATHVLVKEIRKQFKEFHRTQLKSTRTSSGELYIVGKGYKKLSD